MNRLALFDCDGTLVDSAANICTAMATSFAGEGLPLPDDAATRRVVGLNLVEAMRELHPGGLDHEHEALARRYKAAFHTLRGQGRIAEPLFEGLVDVIAALEADGWMLGVATGKSNRGLTICLDHHGLRQRFVTLQTADRHPSKPHPSMVEQAMAEAGSTPATTVVIGDTSFDMAMARAAGAGAIGVAWGYHPAEELIEAGAEAVARTPAELLVLMRERS